MALSSHSVFDIARADVAGTLINWDFIAPPPPPPSRGLYEKRHTLSRESRRPDLRGCRERVYNLYFAISLNLPTYHGLGQSIYASAKRNEAITCRRTERRCIRAPRAFAYFPRKNRPRWPDDPPSSLSIPPICALLHFQCRVRACSLACAGHFSRE